MNAMIVLLVPIHKEIHLVVIVITIALEMAVSLIHLATTVLVFISVMFAMETLLGTTVRTLSFIMIRVNIHIIEIIILAMLASSSH